MATVQKLWNRLYSYQTSQETAIKFMTAVGLLANKIENLLFSENVVIGQSSSKCPGLSVRTVKRGSTYFIPQHILFISVAGKFLANIKSKYSSPWLLDIPLICLEVLFVSYFLLFWY